MSLKTHSYVTQVPQRTARRRQPPQRREHLHLYTAPEYLWPAARVHSRRSRAPRPPTETRSRGLAVSRSRCDGGCTHLRCMSCARPAAYVYEMLPTRSEATHSHKSSPPPSSMKSAQNIASCLRSIGGGPAGAPPRYTGAIPSSLSLASIARSASPSAKALAPPR